MVTASDLPVELHAGIMESLHHYRDRDALTAAALVNKDWCKRSQRILFSVVTDHWYDDMEREDSVRSTHMRFLRTVTQHPDRFGPLVHSYAQNSMACNAASTSIPGLPNLQATHDLWELTVKALPAMVNLKHLYLKPIAESWPANDGWVSSYTLLSSFTFQLESLAWKNYFHPQNGLSGFLATQQHLIHLENGHYPDSGNLSWLEDVICPHLISVAGGFNSLTHVARSRTITAWEWYRGSNDADLFSGSSLVLAGLKYLSVHNYEAFRAIVGPIDLTVDLLQLSEGGWNINTIISLANLPSLRVLVIIQGRYSEVTSQDITQSAPVCFTRLPTLKYIIVRYPNLDSKEFRFKKLSLLPGSTQDILQEDLDIYYDLGMPWWTI